METPSDGLVHRWHLPREHAALIGPGASHEIVIEDVLGSPTEVFKHRPPNLPAVLLAAGERFGDAPYLVFPDLTLSFRDVVASASRVASWLAEEHGVRRGDRVALAGANVPAHPVALLATLMLGGVVAGLNGWWAEPELAYGIELTDPTVVLADRRRADRLVGVGVPVADMVELERFLGAPQDDDPVLPPVEIDEDEPALIVFTSGTTGRPKGATLSHRNLVHGPMAALFTGAITAVSAGGGGGLRPPGASLHPAPLFHVSGVLPLCISLLTGNSLVFPPVGSWDPVVHLKLTERHRVTSWPAVPTQFWRLLEHPDFDRYETSSVQQLSGGGSTIAPELWRLMKEKVPHARFAAGYGMSETTGSGTRIGGVTIDTHPASVGTVEPLCQIRIRDAEGRDVPDGEVGEICIKGACVFRGYWNNDEATAKVLDEDRWYRTGDYGRFEEDILYLESRMRDLIIRGGENIYPIEIENRLVEHPGIREASVVGVEHRQLGQEVAAVVVPHDGASLDTDDVRRWVADALAPFKVPAHIVFVESLPYNATGKVLKNEVEHQVASMIAADAAGPARSSP